MNKLLVLTLVTMIAHTSIAVPGRALETASKKTAVGMSTSARPPAKQAAHESLIKIEKVYKIDTSSLKVLVDDGILTEKDLENYIKMMSGELKISNVSAERLESIAKTFLSQLGREIDLLTSAGSKKRSFAFGVWRKMGTRVLPQLIAEGSPSAVSLAEHIAVDLPKLGAALAVWNGNSKQFGITVNSKDNAEVAARKTAKLEEKLKEEEACVM